MDVRKRLEYSALFTVLFAAVASGYRYLSLGYSGDSTMIYEGGDRLYQISLGRFLQPVYWMVRGSIVAPYIVGLFATAFLFLSVFLISHVLQFNHLPSIAVLAAILTTNETVSLSNATYLPWTDVYALALLFACIGVMVDSRYRLGFLLSPFFYACTLALYPSYITCGATLLVLMYMVRLLQGMPAGSIWKKGIRSILSLFLGLILYAVILRILLSHLNMQASNEYNGVGRLEEITIASFLENLPTAYLLPFIYLFNPQNRLIIPSHQALIPAVLNLAFLLALLPLVFFALRKLRTGGRVTLLCLFAVLPFAMNFVFLISNGIINGLMIVSIYLFYLVPVILLEHTGIKGRFFAVPVVGLFCIYVGMNVITSNRLAIKRDVEYRSTLSAFTRILSDAGEIPSYVPGETPVLIIGYLPSSRISMVREGLEDLNPLQGARYTYAAAYETSTKWYLSQICGSSIRFFEEHDWEHRWGPEIKAMNAYPVDGYIQMIHGVLVINLM
ncbi:MAG: glucosyltransferase domain-containing protein [Clostridia bacterium]|nr:glucosyltransferase domain-containing protein [Clostridia bacterium]